MSFLNLIMVSKYLYALVFQVQCPSLNGGSPRWAAAHFQDDDRRSSSSCSCSVRHHLWHRQQLPRSWFSTVFVTFCDIFCTVKDICDTFYWSNSVLYDTWRLCFFTVLTIHHLQFLVTSHKIHFLLCLVLSSLMLSTDFCWDQVSLVVKNSLFWRFVASSLLALGGKDFELFISLVEPED